MSTKTMQEMKNLIKESLGTPKSNQNAATVLAGTEFVCENKKGEFVTAILLPTLSAHGKVQALLNCAVDGCNETHTREMSDFHQAHLCRTHSAAKKVKLTPEQKLARKVEKAKKVLAEAGQPEVKAE
jgi:hypothetical protein